MRRIKKVVFIFLVMFSLCSCSQLYDNKEKEMFFKNSDEEYCNKRFEEIVLAIEQKDKMHILNMFSDNVKKNKSSKNIEENIEKLFDFIEGDIQKWEKNSGPGVSENVNNGKKSKIIHSYYNLYTTEETYFFLIDDYRIDETNKENGGIYLLLAVKENDRMKIYDDTQKILFDNGKELSPSGVCVPFYEEN